jgi:hypothetical protein
MHGDADLLEVVLALRSGSSLADLLDRREQKTNEDRDDRDDDQKLNQRETAAPLGRRTGFHGHLRQE